MIVISRFRLAVDVGEVESVDDPAGSTGPTGSAAAVGVAGEFLRRAEPALAAFAARPGFLRGYVGRAADDRTLWTIVTEWDSVGSFRRSLSAFDVKMYGAPLLAEAIEEPSAFEVLAAVEGGASSIRPSALAADADSVRVGEAATPSAPRDVSGA